MQHSTLVHASVTHYAGSRCLGFLGQQQEENFCLYSLRNDQHADDCSEVCAPTHFETPHSGYE